MSQISCTQEHRTLIAKLIYDKIGIRKTLFFPQNVDNYHNMLIYSKLTITSKLPTLLIKEQDK